jgi:predicted nucleic acid-binding protein
MLIDTTVWVDHLRRGDAVLVGQLEDMQVSIHPFVVGELACGRMKHRDRVLSAIDHLPTLPVSDHAEVLEFVEAHQLMGRGLGWVDMHLLASASSAGEKLLTRDRRLRAAAEEIGLT